MTGDTKVADVAANTNVAFKNDEHVETAENLDIIMPMYNLTEYSNNYAYLTLEMNLQ